MSGKGYSMVKEGNGYVVRLRAETERYGAVAGYVLSRFGGDIVGIEVRHFRDIGTPPSYEDVAPYSAAGLVLRIGDEIRFRMSGSNLICVGKRPKYPVPNPVYVGRRPEYPPGTETELDIILYLDMTEAEVLDIIGEMSAVCSPENS